MSLSKIRMNCFYTSCPTIQTFRATKRDKSAKASDKRTIRQDKKWHIARSTTITGNYTEIRKAGALRFLNTALGICSDFWRQQQQRNQSDAVWAFRTKYEEERTESRLLQGEQTEGVLYYYYDKHALDRAQTHNPSIGVQIRRRKKRTQLSVNDNYHYASTRPLLLLWRTVHTEV